MSTGRAAAASLRPYLPADAALCAAVFRTAIAELTVDDYSEDQREAWASRANDVVAFGTRLAGALTLIAIIEGRPVGFASLKDDIVDMLFVSPAEAGQGIGTMLLDALIKLAGARGIRKLSSEVSDTARQTFERQGFVAERRNIVRLGDEWLANTTMVKPLIAADNLRSSPTKFH
jgi:putative acetyltransferase